MVPLHQIIADETFMRQELSLKTGLTTKFTLNTIFTQRKIAGVIFLMALWNSSQKTQKRLPI